MPKMKTHRGAAKRLKVTGSGKVMYKAVGKRHNLGSMKNKRQKRTMNVDREVFKGDMPRVQLMLGLPTSQRSRPYVKEEAAK